MTTNPGIITESGAEPLSVRHWREPSDQRLQGLLDRYRLTLAAILLGLLLLDTDVVPYGHHDPRLALLAGAAWLSFGAFRPLARRKPSLTLQLAVDITLVTLLIHTSGGVSSGLGMLLILPLALAGVMLPARIATLFAALAALALLGEELHAHLANLFAPNYFQAGLSGAIYFVTALLAAFLAQRLRESERHIEEQSSELAGLTELNAHIIEQMRSGIVVADGTGRLQRMNQAAARALRIDPQNPPATLAELSQELAEAVERWQGHGHPTDPLAIHDGRLSVRLIPLMGMRKGGFILHLEENAALAQQAQQMKLAALGRLTASIAHEIRNPLGAIGHATQLLRESSRLDGTERRLAEIIHNQTGRVNTIIENILQLGRGRPADIRGIQLKPWLEGVVAELRETEPDDGVAIRVEVAPPGLTIHFDPLHLQQVIWNLYRNARNAAGDRLELHLLAALSTEDDTPYLQICDNGPGIEPGVEERIFEPFFTTGAQHTGLGLYIVRELCAANQATIQLLPGRDGGACFRIRFAVSPPELPR